MYYFRRRVMSEGGLPYAYKVPYIKSTGTQYIDTGVNVASDIRLVVDGMFTKTSGSQQMGTNSNDIYNVAFVFGIASSKWIFRGAGSSAKNSGTADTNRHVFSIESGLGKVDSAAFTIPAYSQSTDGDHLYLFARHNGTVVYGACSFEMYSCQIYKNDVLVRDFIPVVDYSDVACLYDFVSKSLFYNIGTGSFNTNAISIPTPTGVSRAYNGSAATATFGAATGATITKYRYGTNGTSWAETTTNPSQTNAGTLYVQAYYTAGEGYTGSGWSSSATIAISRASRTLSFASSSSVVMLDGTVTNVATPSAGASDGTLTYSSGNTSYATVSSTGVVTAKTTETSVTISATISGGRNYTDASASYTLHIVAAYDFAYTGSVQRLTLPPGRYQLQCWGAQGGSNAAYSTYGITAQSGGKGGYSIGQLTVSQATDVRVYVGGQGSATAGGYNGGGSTTGTSQYDASNELGYTKMGGGGGATDIRLSSGTLLSRMIVAGGGSGGSAGIKRVTVPEITEVKIDQQNNLVNSDDYMVQTAAGSVGTYVEAGEKYRVTVSSSSLKFYRVKFMIQTPGGSPVNTNLHYQDFSEAYSLSFEFTVDSPLVNQSASYIRVGGTSKTKNSSAAVQVKLEKIVSEGSVTTTSKTHTGFAGGGTTGLGWASEFWGKQTSAGEGGSFGQGANQTASTIRYASAAGGGGWYGGGCYSSDSNIGATQCSGGGSGWVNTSASASNRPSGYTGLQLDSGTTYTGNTSFVAPGGGNETGHAGNGYARITRLS